MRYDEFEKCGIHSRLKNIIKLSGGYNSKLARNLIMKEYNIEDKKIAYEMTKYKNIREEIDKRGLDEVVRIISNKIKQREVENKSLVTALERLLLI